MKNGFVKQAILVVSIFILLLTGFTFAAVFAGTSSASADPPSTDNHLQTTTIAKNEFSGRLIVELQGKPLVSCCPLSPATAVRRGRRFDPGSSTVRLQLDRIDREQESFLSRLQKLSRPYQRTRYCDSRGQERPLRYRTLFNGLVLDPGPDPAQRQALMTELRNLPGVKAVYPDRALQPALFASRDFIGTQKLWAHPSIKAITDAGRGVKIAILDSGIHHFSPMFSGEGFSYPPEIPAPGLGDTRNNNGKIIASRAYFRGDDPPAPGEESAWPGPHGDLHGGHVAGIAAGNPVSTNYYGIELELSGVAPAAWLMSYRLNYLDQKGKTISYAAETLAAFEDAVNDGADIINFSWRQVSRLSSGGYYDLVDRALVNAVRAGVFVVVAAGNEGPDPGTIIHPSADYLTVGSTTCNAHIYSNLLLKATTSLGAATPRLDDIDFEEAEFSAEFEGDRLFLELTFTDDNGCRPWAGQPFAGQAVLVERGDCDFSEKVFQLQRAGAAMVIVYNDVEGGNELFHMGSGSNASKVTIPAELIGHHDGLALRDWCLQHGDQARFEVTRCATRYSDEADLVSDFSCRGPGAGATLKPDLVAPGDHIISQGDLTRIGEERFLGYTIMYGTSMAAPHVAGAAALLMQIHPDWPNSFIRSALMTTARFRGVQTMDGEAALPLDIGAGRIDLTRAADPGIACQPPSLSFGQLVRGRKKTIAVTITNLTDKRENYALSALNPKTAENHLAGISFSPTRLTLEAGASRSFTVTFESGTAGVAGGDLQGHILLTGEHHQAHLPLWSRIIEPPEAKILLIDNDGSDSGDYPDYQDFYTGSLRQLRRTFDVWEVKTRNETELVPTTSQLESYRTVILFCGNRYYPLSDQKCNRLFEYVRDGGRLLVMGRPDNLLADGSSDLLYDVMGVAGWVSISAGEKKPLGPHPLAPASFRQVSLELAPANYDSLFFLQFNQDQEFTRSWWERLKNNFLLIFPSFSYNNNGYYSDGTVVLARSEQPSLEIPLLTYSGRSVYATFGLEAVNNRSGFTSRNDFLKLLLDLLDDEPTTEITGADNPSRLEKEFEATLSSPVTGTRGVSYRWDFGDGSASAGPFSNNQVTHTFARPGNYLVRVEATDNRGNQSLGEYLVRQPDTLYFPHCATIDGWKTEIAIINLSPESNLTGTLIAYTDDGQPAGEIGGIELPPRGRRQFDINESFPASDRIGYLVFSADSDTMTGYNKFYQPGNFRVAVPAVKELNRTRIFVPHIASTDGWFTGLSLINVTASPRPLFIETDNGLKRTIVLAPGEHRALSIRSLFENQPQPAIRSLIIDNCAGIIGLELFGSGRQLSGIPLQDRQASTIIYPHIASSETWWTGIAAYNCRPTSNLLDFSIFDDQGKMIARFNQELNGFEHFVSSAAALSFPEKAAWFKIDAEHPLTGFELFGTSNGYQLAGYSGMEIVGNSGVFAKLEKEGFTGIALANTTAHPARITLRAFDNNGRLTGAARTINLAAYEKRSQTAEQLLGHELSTATYVSYTSDQPLAAFQLNGTSDGLLLDALPALH